jgi:phosphate acetyltransferase
VSLESAVEAQRLGLIDPVLVGPAARIRDEAAKAGIELGSLPVIDTAHSHDSAAKAVEQVRLGHAEALMKGSLHTDELMGAVASCSARGCRSS